MDINQSCLNPLNIKKYWKNKIPPDISSLVKKNEKFEDKDFPKGNTWKRINEILPNFKVFKDNTTQYTQIIQGRCGDCYFISVLALLSQIPNLINQKFRQIFTEIGYYEIILFVEGEWQIVFIDDYFECENNRLINARSNNDNAIWGILLEKAWAKINGGYLEIVGRTMIDSTTALIGVPSEMCAHDLKMKSELSDTIFGAVEKGLLLTGSTLDKRTTGQNLKNVGLKYKHSYSILNGNEQTKEICLYDPHGQTLQMGFKEYFRYFNQTLICYLPFAQHIKNFYLNHQVYYKVPILFKVKINKTSKFAVRVFFKNRNDVDSICACSCLLFKVQNTTIQNLETKWGNLYPINLETQLNEGDYIVWVFKNVFKSKSSPSEEKYYVISFSYEEQCSVEYYRIDKNFDFTQYLLLNNYKKLNSNKKGLVKIIDYLVGMNFLVLFNNSNDNYECNMQLDYKKGEILPPHDKWENNKLIIPSRGGSVIVFFSYSPDEKLKANKLNVIARFFNFLIPKEKRILNLRGNSIIINFINNNNSVHESFRYFAQSTINFLEKESLKEMQLFLRRSRGPSQEDKDKYRNELDILKSKFGLNYEDPNVGWFVIDTQCGVYLGEISSNPLVLNGKGVLIENNTKKIGNWVNSRLNGIGIIYEHGNVWKGNFSNDKKNSIGIMKDIQNNKHLLKYKMDNFLESFDINDEKFQMLENLPNDLFLEETEKLFESISINLSSTIIDNYSECISSIYHSRISDSIIINNEEFQINPFIQDLLQTLIYDDEIVFTLKQNNKTQYYGQTNEQNKKHGYGVLYNGDKFYVGLFEDDCPDESCEFKVLNSDKTIEFMGYLNRNYSYLDNHIGTIFYNNGIIYKGIISNNRPSERGSYIHPDGNVYLQLHLENQISANECFFENGLIFKNGKVTIKEHFSSPNSQKFFEEYQTQYPEIINRLLKLQPFDYSEQDLTWDFKRLPSNCFYIGELKNRKMNGRGCIKYDQGNVKYKYYVGYIRENKFQGQGIYYDKNWNCIYCGEFKDNLKHGFGKYNRYIGYFKNDNKDGLGVEYDINYQKKFEGNYSNGKRHGKGFIIDLRHLIISEVKYDNGNLVSSNYRREENFNNIETVLENLFRYEQKYKQEFFKLQKINEHNILERRIKNFIEGKYIGELNQIGFKHGRGVLIFSHTNEYYIGYFKDNMKEGSGKIFYSNGIIKYHGKFKKDKPFGAGKYFLENGDTIEGTFDEIGQGEGTYRYVNGTKYKGPFFAWKPHGRGMFFDNGNESTRNYSYGQEI